MVSLFVGHFSDKSTFDAAGKLCIIIFIVYFVVLCSLPNVVLSYAVYVQ